MFGADVRQTDMRHSSTVRIAMLGGTFDPVHIGHLRSAVELGEALALDAVRILPAQSSAWRLFAHACQTFPAAVVGMTGWLDTSYELQLPREKIPVCLQRSR